MEAKEIISDIFSTKTEDLTTLYSRLISKISDNEKNTINKNLKEKISENKNVDINSILITGAILNYTGSTLIELISYFSLHIDKRINLNQYNFLVKALFNDNPPLPTDMIFDLAEYTYLDTKVIERKIDEVTKKLASTSNSQIILFLLILFFRNDLRNENYKLIYEVLLKLGGNKIKDINNNRVVKDFLKEVKPEKKQQPVKKPNQKKPVNKKTKTISEEIKKEKAVIPETKTTPIKKIIPKPEEKRPDKIKKYLLIGASFVIILIILTSIFSIIKHKKLQSNQKPSPEISNKQQTLQKNEIIKPKKKEATNLKKQVSKTTNIKNSSEELKQYVIKKGDTLSGIAKKYYGRGYYYKHLADVNKIKNPDLIYPGTKIVVPQDVNKKNSNDNKNNSGN